MVILDTVQGSNDWMIERLWRLTASNLKSNITSTGKLSTSIVAQKSIGRMISGLELKLAIAKKIKDSNGAITIDDYEEDEISNLISLYTGEKFKGSKHTDRGHDLEHEAIAEMSDLLGTQIEDVGMCVIGDNEQGVISCSPDGRINAGGKMIEGAEIKSPCLFNFKNHVLEGVLPADYKMQVHASMAICDLDVWHFGSYFKGKPLFYVKVERDDFTDKLSDSLEGFKAMYSDRFDLEQKAMDALENRPKLLEGKGINE